MTALREQLFWSNVDQTVTGCWRWQGTIKSNGYGVFGRKGTRLAHRLAYQFSGGTIPAGLQLDHLCRVRDCVNPLHLEPVTSRENTRRGIAGDSWGYIPDVVPRKPTKVVVTSCVNNDCVKPRYMRDKCSSHYRAWLHDPSTVRPPAPSIEERFWAFVDVTAGCWLWTGYLNVVNGYGQFGTVTTGAHRFSFELAYGAVPANMDVHHTCHVRRCVNPMHLEAVTRSVNLNSRLNRRIVPLTSSKDGLL